MEFKDNGNSTASALSQSKPECERKAGAGFCTLKGSEEKCKCPKELLTQIEYGACTKHTGGFGSTACIMKGTDGPTADDVFCVCPETQSLAQPSKKKLPKCSRHPDTKECWKRDVNEQCEYPGENSLAE